MPTTTILKDSDPIVAGLRNIGNTCYLSACLQAMASSPALVHHVLQLARLMGETQQPDDVKQPLMHHLLSSLRAAYRFLVQGPDDTQLTQEYLRAKAAQGQFTQQLADILAALQPRSAAQPQQTSSNSSSNGVTESSFSSTTKNSSVIDPSSLLSTLRWYIPEGVLDSGLEHDTAEAFQAVIDAVSIELTCWQQLHLHNSSSSSSSHWPHFSPSGLKAIMQADFADVIRPVASAQQEQQPQQQSYHQLHQQPHEEGIVGLQHSVGAAESCCSSSSKLNNSCGHTACNGAEQQQPEAEAAVRHHQQNQQSMTKQQRHEQEEAVLQQPKQQSPQQQQQQAPVIHSRLPVIGHSIDFITCQGCGYRFPRSLTPFVCLPLLLPVIHTAAGDLCVPLGTTLQHCIERHGGPERIEGVECLKCSLKATLAAAAAVAASCATAGSATSQKQLDRTLNSSGTDDDKADWQPNGQQIHSNTQQQQQQQQQQPLADLSSLSSLSAPLPPVNYQQLVQQAGFPWFTCHKTVTKQTRLARPPTVLVIQLQRCVHTAGGGQRKVQGHVGFPLVLDLADYVHGEEDTVLRGAEGQHQHQQDQQLRNDAALQQQQQEHRQDNIQQQSSQSGDYQAHRTGLQQASECRSRQLLYDCTAVVQHLGAGQASGHYIMYRRLEMSNQQQPGSPGCSGVCCCQIQSKGCWLRVNDSRVCPAGEQEVLQCHATLLVYERRMCP